MKNPLIRPQEALAWIGRSVFWICGGAFLLVSAKLSWKSYDRLYWSAQPQAVVALSLSKEELDLSYWQAFWSAHLPKNTQLRRHHLEQLRQLLLQTGYFARVELALEGGRLILHYLLHRPLARLEGQEGWCLYSSQRLLPYLKTTPDRYPSCWIHLGSNSPLQEQLQVAEELFAQLAPSRQQRCQRIDLQGWLGKEQLGSELVLQMQLGSTLSPSSESHPASCLFYLRMGGCHLRSGGADPLVQRALELARVRSAVWIDARLEQMLVVGLSNSSSPLK